MATRLLAETLLNKINHAERHVRRAKRALDDARYRHEKALEELYAFLNEAETHGLRFDYDEITGERELVPPALGFDGEFLGKIVPMARTT